MNGSNSGGPPGSGVRPGPARPSAPAGSGPQPGQEPRPGTVGPVPDTNVVRVPFGVRRSIRRRPERPERWATLVLPFQGGSDPTPPPQAA